MSNDSIGISCRTSAKRWGRFGTDALGRGVRDDEVGVGRFDLEEPIVERVVLAVGDLGVVEDMVAIQVMAEAVAQLGRFASGFGDNAGGHLRRDLRL